MEEAIAMSDERRKARHDLDEANERIDKLLDNNRKLAESHADTMITCAFRGNKCGKAPPEMVALYQYKIQYKDAQIGGSAEEDHS